MESEPEICECPACGAKSRQYPFYEDGKRIGSYTTDWHRCTKEPMTDLYQQARCPDCDCSLGKMSPEHAPGCPYPQYLMNRSAQYHPTDTERQKQADMAANASRYWDASELGPIPTNAKFEPLEEPPAPLNWWRRALWRRK